MEKDDEKFFYEDEVATVSPKSGLVKYGLVLTTNKTRSESELKKTAYKSPDEIKVIWHPNGSEEIISDNKVVLMDRSLMPGDVVRKVREGKPSQFGYCENIDIYATVKILNTNKIIENISSRNFTHTKTFPIDSSVFYESWVGGVYDVKCQVTFCSQDGSVFILEDPFRQDFISLSTSDNFSVDDNVFFQGQKLKMCLDSLENAKFSYRSNLMNCLWHSYKKKYDYKFTTKWIKVYVKNVTVSAVEVEWYCQASSRTKPREEHWPERLITGDNLNKLKTIDLFESCSIQVGDTHWYTIKDTDNLITTKQWRSKCTEAFITGSDILPTKIKKDRLQNKLIGTNKQLSKTGKRIPFDLEHFDDFLCTQHLPSQTLSVEDIKGTTILGSKLAISSQFRKSEPKPSSSTIGNSSIHTMKSNRLKRNRMWKSLVKKSKKFNIPKVSTKSNSKVVVEICYTKSVVDVIWQDGTRETGVSSTDLYPVQTLDDLEFFPGDFVTEKNPDSDVYGVIESVDHAERTARVQWFKVFPENPTLPMLFDKTDYSVYDLRDHPDFHFKSGCLIIHISPETNPDINTLTAGQVLSAGPDGKILVMWVNGEKTQCWPQQLFVVKLHDDEDDDEFSYQDGEYEDGDDAPLAIDDELSEDWMSITTSPGSSNKSRDQENNERLPVIVFQSLTQAALGIKSLLEAVEHNHDINKVITLQKSLEQIKFGCNVSSYSPNSKTKEIESSYSDLMDNFTKVIDNIISGTGVMKKKEGEEELSCETLIGDSVVKLKSVVSEFMDKVNKIFKDSTNCSMPVSFKYCQKEEKHELIEDLIDDYNMDINESIPILKSVIQKSTECMDTDVEPEECVIIAKPEEAGVFEMVETLLENSHKYSDDITHVNPSLLKIISKDIQILQKSLPAGIWVKTFENRMDLFSVMIRGPEKTPYSGGLFLFDVKLPHNYPSQPPLCHYFSFCDDRLNPNLYEDGKVCLSLLGTWSGHGVELWSPKDSNLLQLLVSIQGLILVSEPYYNEAGFETQRGQKLAKENSRVYNEMALIKVVQSMTNILNMNSLDNNNAKYFKNEILEHVKSHGQKLINTIENWITMSERELSEDEKLLPGYPLLPLSKGFCLSINKALKDYKEVLASLNSMFQ